MLPEGTGLSQSGAWKRDDKNIISIYANAPYLDGFVDLGLIDTGK
jgi:hypothetical protein